MRNSKSKSSIARYEALAEMPCLIGHYWPNEARHCCDELHNHHLTSIARRKTDDQRTIRLCKNHHVAQSPLRVGEAYHKGSKLFRQKYGNDETLLKLQNELLGE